MSGFLASCTAKVRLIAHPPGRTVFNRFTFPAAVTIEVICEPPSTIHFSSRHRPPAVCHRSTASFAMQVLTTQSKAGGVTGWSEDIAGGQFGKRYATSFSSSSIHSPPWRSSKQAARSSLPPLGRRSNRKTYAGAPHLNDTTESVPATRRARYTSFLQSSDYTVTCVPSKRVNVEPANGSDTVFRMSRKIESAVSSPSRFA
jgi:hypothetical protein